MTNKKNFELEKKLALLQIAATVAATIGSVIMAMGISLIVFSLSVSIEAPNQTGELYKFLRIVEGQSNTFGYLMIAIGAVFFFITIGLIALKIHTMKDPLDS